MLCYLRKSIKIDPTSIKKAALKFMLQFSSILEPTWLCFGTVLGDKMGPRWHQMAPKIDSKIYTKNDYLFDHPRIDF